MGGAVGVPGNVTPVAEANIWHDVEAAAAVLDAAWPVTVVGLDVTMGALFEERHRDALAGGGAVPAALADMLETYYRYYEGVFGRPCCALHDPLAAAIAVDAIGTTSAPVVPVVVDTTDGPNRGRTTADLRGRFRGFPLVAGARHRVVLGIEPGFPDVLADALLTVGP